jgi:hypothetical protein
VLLRKFPDILQLSLDLSERWQQFPQQRAIPIQKELLVFGLRAAMKSFVRYLVADDEFTCFFSSDLSGVDMQQFQNAYDVALGGLFDRQFGELGNSRDKEIAENLAWLKKTFLEIYKFENSWNFP